MANTIKVEGLQEFDSNLRDLESNIPLVVRRASEELATTIRRFAQSRIPTDSGRARRSIQVESKREIVRVIGGNSRVSYYGWLEFGGIVGVDNSVRRRWEKRGRFIYEGYFKEKSRISEVMEASLNEGIRDAGLGE